MKETTKGYVGALKMMCQCMRQGTVEDMIMRLEPGGRMDICGIATEGLHYDDTLSWFYWYALATLMPLLHEDVRKHPEQYETQATAHVMVLEQLRARLDAWRYGYLDLDDVKRYVPDDEPERQRAALDFAIRSFEAFLQKPDPSGEAP